MFHVWRSTSAVSRHLSPRGKRASLFPPPGATEYSSPKTPSARQSKTGTRPAEVKKRSKICPALPSPPRPPCHQYRSKNERSHHHHRSGKYSHIGPPPFLFLSQKQRVKNCNVSFFDRELFTTPATVCRSIPSSSRNTPPSPPSLSSP